MTFRACVSLLVLFLLASVSLAKEKPPITDDTIYDQVRLRLANDQVVKGAALQVSVKEGVVTLGGEVEQNNQKERATKLAKKVRGVKQVVNNISLRGQPAGK